MCHGPDIPNSEGFEFHFNVGDGNDLSHGLMERTVPQWNPMKIGNGYRICNGEREDGAVRDGDSATRSIAHQSHVRNSVGVRMVLTILNVCIKGYIGTTFAASSRPFTFYHIFEWEEELQGKFGDIWSEMSFCAMKSYSYSSSVGCCESTSNTFLFSRFGQYRFSTSWTPNTPWLP